eukprot:3361112-Pleurochrysis_carterae.AAC.3
MTTTFRSMLQPMVNDNARDSSDSESELQLRTSLEALVVVLWRCYLLRRPRQSASACSCLHRTSQARARSLAP